MATSLPAPNPTSCLARKAALASASACDGGGGLACAASKPPGTSNVSMAWIAPLSATTSEGQPLAPMTALSSQFLRKRRSYLRLPPCRVSWSEVSESSALRPGITWYFSMSAVTGVPCSLSYLSSALSHGARMVYSPSDRSMPFASSAAANLPKLSSGPSRPERVSMIEAICTDVLRVRTAGRMSRHCGCSVAAPKVVDWKRRPRPEVVEISGRFDRKPNTRKQRKPVAIMDYTTKTSR